MQAGNVETSKRTNPFCMKQLFTTCIIVFIAMTTSAQTRIPLWDDVPPYNRPEINKNEMWDGNNVSNVSIPELYHFSAVESSKPRPAIIIVPGGGYARQAFSHEGTMVAEWFTRLGFEAFVLKYRLPDPEIVDNRSFVPMMDGQQAIHYVRSHAAEFNIDPARVGIMGFSAGGHLAASVATLFGSPVNTQLKPSDVRPDFSILVYPVITMEESHTHAGSRERLLGLTPSVNLIQQFSLEKQVSGEMPNTLLIHSFDDKSVPVDNSELFSRNMHQAGADVTKIILPEGGHGYGFRPASPVAYWINYLEIWLKSRILSE